MQILRSMRLAVLAFFVLAIPLASSAQISISIGIAPPALPVYVQPPCPADGYLWTPGYWAYTPDDGYYWVPGTWVEAPQPGYLWTPGYWGWGDGGYAWHEGYWGEHVGFYGGVDYGFGYGGDGYEGGRWQGGRFEYNRSVSNVNVNVIHNVYNQRVVVHNTSRVSFNGGRGGIDRRPTANEERFSHEQHVQRTSMQNEHEHAAAGNRNLRASVNHGKPAIAATAKPGQFSGHGVVAARQAGAPYHAPAANRAANKPAAAPRTENKAAARPGNAPNRAGNNSARPENKTPARTETSKPTPARTNNKVARPPANNRENTPRPENNEKPKAAPAEHASRPANTTHTQAPRENAPRATPAPRPESKPQPQREARPQTQRAPSTPRPESHPQAARPQAAPHPQAAPRAEKPQAAPREEKPEEKKH
jgi:hypothetical protein